MKQDFSTQLSADFAALESIFEDLSSGHFFSMVGYRRFTHPEFDKWQHMYGQWTAPEEGGLPEDYRKMISKDFFIPTLKDVLYAAKQFAGIGEDSPQDRLAVSIIGRILQILPASIPTGTLIQETFMDKGSQTSHTFVIKLEDFAYLFSVQCVID